jgi:hypothetical protein
LEQFPKTKTKKLSITRTIKVSCLSRFLLLLLVPRQIRNNIYRDCARAHLLHSIPGLRLGHFVKLYHDTRITKLAPAMTAKTRAIPSLHRDNFSAKEPGLWPVLASGNATSLYCRAVSIHASVSTLNLKMARMLTHLEYFLCDIKFKSLIEIP